ncbi:MAG: hypothetical protein ACYTF1_16070 [Planctomycetota bacterium]|jgi:hypothetical protein
MRQIIMTKIIVYLILPSAITKNVWAKGTQTLLYGSAVESAEIDAEFLRRNSVPEAATLDRANKIYVREFCRT